MTQPPEPGRDDGDVARLNAALDDVLGGPVPYAVRWADLDPQNLAAELHVLTGWVRWLVTRYALDHRDVPPCWYRHGALVEELTALRGAWDLAYDPAQSAAASADWQLTFAHARLRLRDWAARTGCKHGEHRPDTIERWARDPEGTGWTAALHNHLDHLGNQAGPA